MTEEPPKDANDVVRAGGRADVSIEPIDPSAVVVSLDRARAARARSAGDGGAGEPPPLDAPMPGEGDGPPGGDRPVIVVTTEEAEVNAAASAALSADLTLYVRGNAIVRVLDAAGAKKIEHIVRDPDAPAIDVAPPEIIQERLAASARFVRMVPDKENDGQFKQVPVHPPKWCVGAVRLRGEWPGFRQLEQIVEAPVLRMDGTVLDQRGYDARSGLLFRGEGRFRAVPQRPTADEVKGALDELADVVSDVYWARPAHRSSWLASVLTPLARYAFRGPAPLFLFEAPTAGSGKGLLVEVAVRIATGRSAPLSSFSSDDAEMDKRILTWASSGSQVVVLDDVSVRLDGDSFRRVLTATTYDGRVLGLTKRWVGPALMTWYATGNNVVIGNEMFRRICPIRILSPVEDPSKRQGFKYPDLKAHVATHARSLAGAALTILRAYCVAGRPDQKLPTWGSYEGWSDLVRSAVVWAGWPDPNETVGELRSAADTRHSSHRALVVAWLRLLQRMGKPSATAKQAIDFTCKSDPGPLPELRALIEEIALGKDTRPSSKLLGYVLRSLHERIFETDVGRLAIVRGGEDRNGTALWSVVELDKVLAPASGAGDGGDAGDPSVLRARDQERSDFPNQVEHHPHHPHHPQGPTQQSLEVDPGDGEPWEPPDDEGSS